MEKGVQRRKVTPEKKAETLARITPSTDYAALGGCDLVVEAVFFEDPKVKAEVTAKIEAAVGTESIVATNTRTLPISGLAKASARPGNYIGIHFFSPVDKMALVEIIRGKQTGDRATAKALDFVRALKKTRSLHRHSVEDLLSVLPRFRGDIRQVPPCTPPSRSTDRSFMDLAPEGREVERAPAR